MDITVQEESWALKQPFRTAGQVDLAVPALLVQLSEGRCTGRGEGQGIYYFGETAASMRAQVDAVAGDIRNGVTRETLYELLPRGGARNAVDCALWDLEAKRSKRSIWELAGVEPAPVTSVFTLGIEATPEAMAKGAAAAADYPVLKIKLDSDRPVERLRAVRDARPDARLVVDANQGLTMRQLEDLLSGCANLGIDMIEQPLPRGGDAALEGFASPIPLAADESCLDRADLDTVARRYAMVNIKLDKTGGLTEALALARDARAQGLKLMAGNMIGTSLAMAPAFVLAQLCDFVDIDGPLLLADDRPHGLVFEQGRVDGIDPRLWG